MTKCIGRGRQIGKLGTEMKKYPGYECVYSATNVKICLSLFKKSYIQIQTHLEKDGTFGNRLLTVGW